MVIIKMYRKM